MQQLPDGRYYGGPRGRKYRVTFQRVRSNPIVRSERDGLMVIWDVSFKIAFPIGDHCLDCGREVITEFRISLVDPDRIGIPTIKVVTSLKTTTPVPNDGEVIVKKPYYLDHRAKAVKLTSICPYCHKTMSVRAVLEPHQQR